MRRTLSTRISGRSRKRSGWRGGVPRALVGGREHVGARRADVHVVVVAGGDEESRARHRGELRIEDFGVVDGARREA